MRKVVHCRSCRRPLSTVLTAETGGADTNRADGEPFVPSCTFHVSDGEFFTGTASCLIINLADSRNLTMHGDVSRLAGCCGLAGCDGPNHLCGCGAEVATEKSDCWMPHALIFELGAVNLLDDAG